MCHDGRYSFLPRPVPAPMGIGRQGLHAPILDRPADGEMVQRLPRQPVEPQQPMHGVVEEAADAGGAHAGGFRFQIENLSQQAGFPEQLAVRPRFAPLPLS